MSNYKNYVLSFLCFVMLGVTACGSEPVLLETGMGCTTETVAESEVIMTESYLKEESDSLIYVYVCGQVYTPGVYPMKIGDRVYQAIELAGGILPEGDGTKVNLAETVYDSQKIYIPSYQEAETFEDSAGTDFSETGSEGTARVNINRASREELMTLPGIGEAKADTIISHREEQGPFGSIEALMDVPGIKEGIYSKIKDRIAIN